MIPALLLLVPLVLAGEAAPGVAPLSPGGVDDGATARAKAAAYVEAGNPTWARRVLAERVVADPSDLETRSWAAWYALSEGDLLAARILLAVPAPDGPLGERIRLLQAVLAEAEGRAVEAREALAGRSGPLLPGDEILRREVRRRVLGDAGEPFSARVQGGGGYSTNPVQSAPQDAGATPLAATGSPVFTLDTVVRWEPWASPRFRPTAEARVKGLLPSAALARSSAWLDLAGRGGVEAGTPTGSRGRVLYSYELLGVNSGDAYASTAAAPGEDGAWPGRRWYMEAHRGEVEADLGAQVQVFGGAGRRVYREMARTRTEVDGGAAVVLPLVGGWNVTAVASGRYQDARATDWDLWGGSALLRVAAPFPGGGLAQVRGMALYDRYDPALPEGRRDVTWGLQVAPWSRPVGGVRVGVSWTLTDRVSSFTDWSYVDHRFLLEARWQPAWGRAAGRAAPVGAGYLPLPYGLDREGDTGLDRVQDLIRQEDSARRGSSCAD